MPYDPNFLANSQVFGLLKEDDRVALASVADS
jgi:hypothetical protein